MRARLPGDAPPATMPGGYHYLWHRNPRPMLNPDDEPRTLREPTTGRPILLAPRRQLRPMHTAGPLHTAAVRRCPFCAGHEGDTPPTLDQQPAATEASAGWQARAFANKYPANQHHEVIAEGSEHSEQPEALPPAVWAAAVRLWQRRIAAMEQQQGLACAFLFKNVGALAGASIAHNHSQLLGLGELPPRLQLELAMAQQRADCPWCATLHSAAADGRLVFRGPAHAIVVPAPNKLPHETWLLPLECGDDFLHTDADALGTALWSLFAAIGHGLGKPAFNLWLHRVRGQRFHWHFELQPRTGQMAGLELGGDMYINSVPPQLSATRLRAGLAAGGDGSGPPQPAANYPAPATSRR